LGYLGTGLTVRGFELEMGGKSGVAFVRAAEDRFVKSRSDLDDDASKWTKANNHQTRFF
jgi:hypothetical protein